MSWFGKRSLFTLVILAGLFAGVYCNGIYGEDAKPVGLTQNSAQIIVGILIISIFTLLALEYFTPEVLLLSSLIIVLLLEILTLPQALEGFSNQSMITIGALFLVVGGVQKSHVVDWMARKTFGTDGSVVSGKIRMFATCFLLSIFFNNTPLVAILLPVVKDWGRMRNVSASQLLMPLSYSVLAGSFISMIGTSTNLTVQGLMQADRGYSFPFFAPAPFGITAFVGLLIYQIVAGPYMLPDQKVGLFRTARDKASSMMAEIYVAPESKAAGKCVGEVMNSLGVSPSSVIKIRRRVNRAGNGLPDGTSTDDLSKIPKSASAGNILDMKYMRGHAGAWASTITSIGRPSEARPQTDEQNSDDAGNMEGTEYTDIIAPAHHEIVAPHDVLFVSSAQNIVEKMMKSIAGESKGLRILNSNAMALPGFGTELLECVVSDSNPFLGMKVSEMAKEFADKYKAGLITVRGKNWDLFESTPNAEAAAANGAVDAGSASATAGAEGTENDIEASSGHVELTTTVQRRAAEYTARVPLDSTNNNNNDNSDDFQVGEGEGRDSFSRGSASDIESNNVPENASFMAANPSVSVSDHVLGYGDIILCVSNEKEVPALSTNKDFFVVSSVGSLPKPLDFYKSIPVVIFVTMLILVATENIDMCSASLTVAVVFLLGGWVKTNEIPTLVDVKLLLLIGSSISFAKAVTTTGLALRVAQIISSADGGAQGALFLVYTLTLMITELISNNAAAALMYPISVALADELGVSFKPFAMCVLLASTACFMSPIGYQTHMMVWGPGGYKFKDFIIFGTVPDILYLLVACLLIPVIIPF